MYIEYIGKIILSSYTAYNAIVERDIRATLRQMSNEFLDNDLTQFCLMDWPILIIWMSPFRVFGVSGGCLKFLLYLAWKCLYANSVYPHQTPRSMASDVGPSL